MNALSVSTLVYIAIVVLAVRMSVRSIFSFSGTTRLRSATPSGVDIQHDRADEALKYKDTTGTVQTVLTALLGALVSSATKFIGYATGAGGAVTQITSSATGVTLSKPTGQITTVALTTAAGAEERFTVTNTLVAATDIIVVSTTYAGAGTPAVSVMAVAAGSFDIVITNLHAANALNAVLIVNFAIIKGVAA